MVVRLLAGLVPLRLSAAALLAVRPRVTRLVLAGLDAVARFAVVALVAVVRLAAGARFALVARFGAAGREAVLRLAVVRLAVVRFAVVARLEAVGLEAREAAFLGVAALPEGRLAVAGLRAVDRLPLPLEPLVTAISALQTCF